jgi:hypothetical protein
LTYALHLGDCREVMASLVANSIDSIVTDPPYELGFMGKKWDATGIAYSVELWIEALRVLKPGGHLLAFGGTRTYHRMACAIEDAGFEVRDSLHWLYGSGFPKSLDVSKAIQAGGGPESIRRLSMGNAYVPSGRGRVNYDHGGGSVMNGAAGDVDLSPDAASWKGWGTALKPAHEPIVMARKPLVGTVAANVLAHGTGALNIDGCRIGSESVPTKPTSYRGGEGWDGNKAKSRDEWNNHTGRWPANVLLDEEAAAMLDEQSGDMRARGNRSPTKRRGRGDGSTNFHFVGKDGDIDTGDTGGASRFFYVAKASRKERDLGCEHLPPKSAGEATDRAEDTDGLNSPRAGAGRTGGARNYHPTVKPVQLMRYLVRMVTPPSGVVLDPFTGSGTTGVATIAEGFKFVGIEREAEYKAIAEARLVAAEAQVALFTESK